jgi:hypothetical protein
MGARLGAKSSQHAGLDMLDDEEYGIEGQEE